MKKKQEKHTIIHMSAVDANHEPVQIHQYPGLQDLLINLKKVDGKSKEDVPKEASRIIENNVESSAVIELFARNENEKKFLNGFLIDYFTSLYGCNHDKCPDEPGVQVLKSAYGFSVKHENLKGSIEIILDEFYVFEGAIVPMLDKYLVQEIAHIIQMFCVNQISVANSLIDCALHKGDCDYEQIERAQKNVKSLSDYIGSSRELIIEQRSNAVYEPDVREAIPIVKEADCEDFNPFLKDDTEQSKKSKKKRYKLPTVSRADIEAYMKQYIIGQDTAVKKISLMAAKQLTRASNPDLPIKKENYLLMGSTGCGKTATLNALAEILPIPIITIDASKLTPSGYKGQNVNDILYARIQCITSNPYFRHSIIVFDEFDKLIGRGNIRSYEEYGTSIQADLLRIIEGDKVCDDKHPNKLFETKNMMFVFAGAFEQCFSKKNVVMASGSKKAGDEDINDLNFVKTKLIQYGAMSEILGRIGNHCILRNLNVDDYANILKQSKNNIFDSYKNYCDVYGAKLKVCQDAISACSEEAVSKKLGVRGMESVIDNALHNQICEMLDGKRKTVTFSLKTLKESKNDQQKQMLEL